MKDIGVMLHASPEELKQREQELQDRITASAEIPEQLKPLIMAQIGKGDHFLHRVYIAPLKKAKHYGLPLGRTHWVIKNDNLKLLETLSTAAMALTTFIAVPTAAPAILAVSLLFSAIAVSERLRTKSASLEPEQYYILMTLKASGPSSVEQLAETLGVTHIFGIGVWSNDRTLEALKALQSIHLRDGTVEPLVTLANTGLWSTNGI
jgi:hypothetical protein